MESGATFDAASPEKTTQERQGMEASSDATEDAFACRLKRLAVSSDSTTTVVSSSSFTYSNVEMPEQWHEGKKTDPLSLNTDTIVHTTPHTTILHQTKPVSCSASDSHLDSPIKLPLGEKQISNTNGTLLLLSILIRLHT